MVTKAPVSSSRLARCGIAVISLPLPPTASWPSTRRWRWPRPRRDAAALRRRASPPGGFVPGACRRAMATISGSASRRSSTQAVKHAAKSGAVHDVVQRVAGGDAARERQQPARKVELAFAPALDLGEIFRARHRRAEHDKQDFWERIGDLPGLTRIAEYGALPDSGRSHREVFLNLHSPPPRHCLRASSDCRASIVSRLTMRTLTSSLRPSASTTVTRENPSSGRQVVSRANGRLSTGRPSTIQR